MQLIKNTFGKHPVLTGIVLIALSVILVYSNKAVVKGTASFLGWVFMDTKTPFGWTFWNNAFPSNVMQTGDLVNNACEKTQHVDEMLEIEPYSSLVLLKCRCLLNQEKLDEAQQCYEGYLEIDKTSYDAYDGLISIALKNGNIEQAQALKATGITEFEKMAEDYKPPMGYHYVDETFRRALGTHATAVYHLENLQAIEIP